MQHEKLLKELLPILPVVVFYVLMVTVVIKYPLDSWQGVLSSIAALIIVLSLTGFIHDKLTK